MGALCELHARRQGPRPDGDDGGLRRDHRNHHARSPRTRPVHLPARCGRGGVSRLGRADHARRSAGPCPDRADRRPGDDGHALPLGQHPQPRLPPGLRPEGGPGPVDAPFRGNIWLDGLAPGRNSTGSAVGPIGGAVLASKRPPDAASPPPRTPKRAGAIPIRSDSGSRLGSHGIRVYGVVVEGGEVRPATPRGPDMTLPFPSPSRTPRPRGRAPPLCRSRTS